MSILASIEIDKPNTLSFEVEMSGHESQDILAKFIIETVKYDISYRAVIEDDIVSVELLSLEDIFIPGVYLIKLVFIIGNNYYNVFDGELELIKPFTVSAKPIVATPSVSAPITVKPIVVNKTEIAPVVEPEEIIPAILVEPEPEIVPSIDPLPIEEPVTKPKKSGAGSVLSRLKFVREERSKRK